LQGLLTGQLSFTQAMKNILLQLSIQVIELMVTKPLAAYIAGQLAMLTATQSGAAATAAAAVAGETAALPAKVAAFTSDITARSALTFAGIFANLAGAEADAARNAVTGGDSGGGGGDTHNWNISAVDGQSMGAWLKAGGAAMLAKAVSGYQDKNPSARNRK
jgi:hypothetical protein